MNGEMHDNFDTCEVMSGRVQHLESELWRLKTLGSEMKEVKRLLHEVLRRLPEEDHSVVTVGDDEIKVTFARKIAQPTFSTVVRKTARPRTVVAATDLPFAGQPTGVASSSVAAPAAEHNKSAVPSHDSFDFGDLPDMSANFSTLNSPRLSYMSFSPPPNLSSGARTTRSRFQDTRPPSPGVKRKADNTGPWPISKRRKEA